MKLKFDVDGDGYGDTLNQTTRCQWNKQWSLPVLPECKITHCIKPFDLPSDTSLRVYTFLIFIF